MIRDRKYAPGTKGPTTLESQNAPSPMRLQGGKPAKWEGRPGQFLSSSKPGMRIGNATAPGLNRQMTGRGSIQNGLNAAVDRRIATRKNELSGAKNSITDTSGKVGLNLPPQPGGGPSGGKWQLSPQNGKPAGSMITRNPKNKGGFVSTFLNKEKEYRSGAKSMWR